MALSGFVEALLAIQNGGLARRRILGDEGALMEEELVSCQPLLSRNDSMWIMLVDMRLLPLLRSRRHAPNE